MALDTVITGANIDANGDIKVALQADELKAGHVVALIENDSGEMTGLRDVTTPEVDTDYRLRVGMDLILDEEAVNYNAQNTGKHNFIATTMAATWTAGTGMTTNSGSITTTTTGVVFSTYATFPTVNTMTLSVDSQIAFSQQPTTNTFIEWGTGVPGAQTVAPTDGVFFRLNSAGLQGIASLNGVEVSTGVFTDAREVGSPPWVYLTNKRYQFISYQNGTSAEFWVDDGTGALKLGEIPLPAGQGRMAMASSGQFFFKHRITGGAAGGVFQSFLSAYNIRIGGTNNTTTMSTQGQRVLGAYQGLSGGTMGTLATYPNSTNPTAAAPSNTALTANLPGGLGGQGAVTAAAAAATDGIWSSYQVPANTVNLQGRRLIIRGIRLDLVNTGAAVATTATTIQFSLAFGHTAVSLATTEAAAAKAPRRIALGFATWPVGAAIGAQPQAGPIVVDLGDAPIFVNPGEFVALVGKFLVGTATASQVINFTYTPIYGWE